MLKHTYPHTHTLWAARTTSPREHAHIPLPPPFHTEDVLWKGQYNKAEKDKVTESVCVCVCYSSEWAIREIILHYEKVRGCVWLWALCVFILMYCVHVCVCVRVFSRGDVSQEWSEDIFLSAGTDPLKRSELNIWFTAEHGYAGNIIYIYIYITISQYVFFSWIFGQF